MSPEQFYGVAETRSDIYSFGIVLYQSVNSGEYPFRPKPGHTWAIAHKTYPVPEVPRHGHALATCDKQMPRKETGHEIREFSGVEK